MSTPLSAFKDPFRKLAPGEDDGFDALRRIMCKDVVDNPYMAGYGQIFGNWEAGEIGACRLVYPTLKLAKKWLKEHPKKRKRRKKA